MSDDSRHQEAIRKFLLHQLSLVSGMPELALAEELIDVETQAFMLGLRATSTSVVPNRETLNQESLQQAQELPSSSALDPMPVATTSGLPPNPLLKSRLPPIREEGPEPGCCPILIDCHGVVWGWIRRRGRSILTVFRGE